MTYFKIRTTLGTETLIKAVTMTAAIEEYCNSWGRAETTIRSIERI